MCTRGRAPGFAQPVRAKFWPEAGTHSSPRHLTKGWLSGLPPVSGCHGEDARPAGSARHSAWPPQGWHSLKEIRGDGSGAMALPVSRTARSK